MSSVWKSVKLDFSLVKSYWKTICFTMALPVVFGAVNRSLMTGIPVRNKVIRERRKKKNRWNGY
ncbi:MAG: hypothetical protein K2N95_00385 [Lachnospiraceae bacterium]|nr:hypothetical protein [Lachnospiraceae bacterium]